MAIGINLKEESYDDDKPLFGRHYLEDEDMGFYGVNTQDKRFIFDSFKALSKKDKEWIINELRKNKYIK